MNIVRRPKLENDNDKFCTLCSKNQKDIKTHIVIKGTLDCFMCGNQINLCLKHANELKKFLDETND